MAYTNIDDPSAYFQTAIYSGSNSDLSVTNDGNSDLKPDFLWIKQRSSTESHMLVDSTRGVSKYLLSNSTTAELTVTSIVETLDTDGFTLNGASNPVNALGATYVGWQWKANGGTTASNTDGSITSTVQANTDAGFSIVTYGGTGSAATLGHGLADTPDVIIFKNRDDTNVWATYHQGIGNNEKLVLNTTAAEDEDGSFMNGTLPTSSVFSVGASVNTNGSSDNYVAYCFAEKQGYSKFGKYVGNGNVNGPFVYLGFQPAWILLKRSDSTSDWYIIDNKRSASGGANVNVYTLYPNLSDAESTGEAESTYGIDFLSNGFKIRASHASRNTSGDTYIYMAFAENPFTTSTGIPTTAR
jgi:hypothetical protein